MFTLIIILPNIHIRNVLKTALFYIDWLLFLAIFITVITVTSGYFYLNQKGIANTIITEKYSYFSKIH